MRKFLVCAGGVVLSLSLYAQRMQHPALLFTKARVEAAKSRMESDTCMARCWSDIRKVADESLKGNNFRRADYLSLAYLMTGDQRYADCLKTILQSLTSAKTWGSEEMLSRKPVWRSDLGLSHKCHIGIQRRLA